MQSQSPLHVSHESSNTFLSYLYEAYDYDDPDDFAEEWAEEFGDGDYDDGYDDGVSLTFVRYGRQYGSLSEIETYEWDTLKDYAKKYDNDRDSGTRSLISGINRNYFEPYVMELVFGFTANANTMIERQIRRMGSIQDDVEETMAGELYADGYIATSQIVKRICFNIGRQQNFQKL